MPSIGEFYSDAHLGDRFGATAGRPNPHRGLDVNRWPLGTPVPAVCAGTVVRLERQSGLGNVIVLRRADGLHLGYSHLESLTLRLGQQLAAGDTVGPLGNTGTLSTGPHLHLTASWTSPNPAAGPVIDPLPIVLEARTPPAPPRPPAPNRRPKLKGLDVFSFIRHPNGTISLINGATGTYRHLTFGEWQGYVAAGERAADVSASDFDATIARLTPFEPA